MSQIKICPDCGTEYFSHIENCADCGAFLLLPEENRRLQEERKHCREKILENPVVIREGDLNWIDELYNVLIDSSIPCVVQTDTGCKKGCSGHPCRLLVSVSDAEKANELIEEHYMNIHPEIRASKEMIRDGKCPACGSPVGPDTVECPDCGLTLLIIE
ncbi:MAG: hypothetical protein GTN76_03745 [Candidatus Aenigmarchaeota archaeon]|nr:hypothetical protein [Candidatus Aenigmarchaeota archaeon]